MWSHIHFLLVSSSGPYYLIECPLATRLVNISSECLSDVSFLILSGFLTVYADTSLLAVCESVVPEHSSTSEYGLVSV